jgi:hypothetical protein
LANVQERPKNTSARLRSLVPEPIKRFLRRREGWIRARMVTRHRGATFATLPPYSVEPMLRHLTHGARTVLDVGCGTMDRLSTVPVGVRIGVDAHRPYLSNRVDDNLLVPVHYDARRMMEIFLPRSFDVVMLIDVIEHFRKSEGLEILDDVERIARSRVVVFTPLGEFPQSDFDAYGLGGEQFQEHRSAWHEADFARRGYSIVVFPEFHRATTNESHRQAFGEGGAPVDALLVWKDVAAEQ